MRFIYSIVVIFASWSLASADFNTEILDRHNYYRAIHGVPNVSLNSTISSWAQDWANYLAANDLFEHRPTDDGYGENLYATTGTPTGDEVIDAFYDEIYDYDFNNPGFTLGTGHFTQLIWKNTNQIGVGIAESSDGWVYVVINYYPPGNYHGQFADNVLPPQNK